MPARPARPPVRRSGRHLRRMGACVLAACVPVGGCIELGYLLTGAGLPNNGSHTDTPTEPDGGAGDEAPATPQVTLTVSNPTPAILEQVQFTCSVSGGGSTGVTFDFQPADARLQVNHTTGVAAIVMDASDVGVGLTFTCTGTNEAGTGPPSNPQTVIPFDPNPVTPMP